VAAFGAPPHVMEMYWPLLQNPYPATEGTNFPCSVLQADQASGIVLMTLIPGDNDAGAGATGEPTEAEIANGTFDAALEGWATGIKTCGQKVLLRFAHEMNGNWYAWSPGQNGNPADGSGFIAMWQHVWNLFQQNGADASLVRWIFSPNVPSGPSTPTPISSVYPGDAYVDILALDGYNWGTGNGGEWQTFTEVFLDGYALVAGLNPTKPIMVAETGCSTSNGDTAKGDWITSALGAEIPTAFPRFETVVYFDIDSDGVDWALDSGPLATRAFASQAQSAFWNHDYTW
jgi:beta-mannanase